MKFAGLKYNVSTNIGDEIQSIAADRFLPRIDQQFDRDSMVKQYPDEPHVIILNGWYSHFPKRCFVPHENFKPVIYGFHMSDWHPANVEHFLSEPCIEYFKANGPIGCRDRRTRDLLIEKGVDAFFSNCITLTLEKRPKEPSAPRVFLVNMKGIDIPKKIAQNALVVEQDTQDIFGPNIKRQMGHRLLDLYRANAGLVVTTRLHCALPCIAMGIPVVFIGDPKNYRLSPLQEVGLPIYEDIADVDWNPGSLNIDEIKKESIARLESLIADRLTREGSAPELANE